MFRWSTCELKHVGIQLYGFQQQLSLLKMSLHSIRGKQISLAWRERRKKDKKIISRKSDGKNNY